MDFRFAFPVLFLRASMVLLTMLYPGEASRAVESDKACTCFTGLLDVCVQALAMQLHALIPITSMMSYLFLADIPGHNQNALRTWKAQSALIYLTTNTMFYIWGMVYFTFGLWCNHVCNHDKILFNHTIYYISVFSVFIYHNVRKHMRDYSRCVQSTQSTTHHANLYNLSPH